MVTTNDMNGKFMVVPSIEINQELNNKELALEAKRELSTLFKRVITALGSSFSLITFIIIIFLLFKFTNLAIKIVKFCTCCCKKKKVLQSNVNLDTALLATTSRNIQHENTIYQPTTQNSSKQSSIVENNEPTVIPKYIKRNSLSKGFYNLLNKVKSTPALNLEEPMIRLSEIKDTELTSKEILDNLRNS